MNKKVKRYKKLVFVGAITLFTALVWVALGSYHQITSRERIQEVSDLLKPLNPQLDLDILDKIEAKREYQPAEVETFLIPTPTPAEDEAPTGQQEQIEEVGTEVQ